MTDVLRAFRSPDFRDLTRKALDQGWVAYLRAGGHVDVVSPAGTIVQLSTTAHTAGPVLRPKRHEFERAGLMLGGPHRSRRANRGLTPIPEAATMTTDTPKTDAPPPTNGWHVIRTVTPQARPGADRHGGIYSYRGSIDVIDVDGYEVSIGQRVDGKWQAYTRDTTKASNRRQWLDTNGRTHLLERVRDGLRADPPTLTAPTAATAPEPAPTPRIGTNGATVHEAVPAPAPTVWRAVGLDPSDYPMAAALDTLHSAAGPAIAALMAAGKTDAANLITAELDLTPTEAELLRLWQAVVRGGPTE